MHPEYRRADAPDTQAVQDSLTPVYPAASGIPQGRLRNLTAQALAAVGEGELPDWLPADIQRDLKLPPLREALQYLHRPPPDARLDELEAGRHPAQRRLAFEELLAHQLTLRQLRNEIRRDPSWPISPTTRARRAHARVKSVSKLTKAQHRVATRVRARSRDRASDAPARAR